MSTGFATGGTANGDSVAQIEAILGTSDADSFTVSGIVVEMFAGGSGNDTFNITASIGSPTIIWGGGGADTINVTTGTNQADGPAGVLMVNVAGLTEENFHLFDIEQLGLGSDFDWGQIDVVIVNPEAADKIFVDGQELTVTNDATVEVYDDVAIDFGIVDGDSSLTPYLSALLAAYQGAGYEIFSDQVITPTEPGVEGTMLPFRRIDLRYNAEISINALAWDSGYGIEHVYNFTEGFLGGTTGLSLVAASGGQFWEARTEIEGIEVPDLFQFPFPMSEVHTGNTVNFAYTDPYGYEFTWVETTHYFLSGWNGNPNGLDAAPVYLGATSSTEALEFTSPDALGNWFVVGGQFAGGNLTSDGSITYVMPDQEDGSGSGSGSGGGTPPPPRGGSYHNSSGASNLGGGEETRRLTNFNASQDTVVISGVALNGSNLASGVTAYESNGSTIIAYGTDDNVVLCGVTLAQWQAGAAGQLLGGAGADSLTGTGGANVFAGGGGADTISAGAGNDRINYASGDDVILGHLSNAGTDTLDLRRFSASDVTFRVSGQDVLISTADGTIRLGSQIQYDLGNARSNIETILFSNGNLTETDIRARAVSDQATDGNDSITGTAFADAINGLAGNDTINASGGNDTISFSGGHDVNLGHLSNAGSDTLDLRQYMASEVSFRVSGQDVLVTTADGTITLGSQLQYAVGNARSNIETVVFSNGSLTEAGIMARAVSDQATGGNDSIIGTASADVINGLSGSDTLSGFAGNDTFGFTSGDDVIIGHLSNFGADTLDLTQFSASGATFRVSGFDVLVTTAQGTIWLESQVRYSTGHERSNIETILFSNGTLNEAAIRARAVSDQATAGANTITGTGQADIIRGLAGNDTITGGAGADVFVFAGGDGADRITDFSRSSGDVIRFYGLTYGDLTISQSGSNAVVNYGSGNVLTLASVTASTLTAAAFEFL